MDFQDDEEKRKHIELATTLLAEQNFTAAVIAGAVATILAAFAFGIVVATWPFAYGFAAAGIGIAVGLAMGYLGRGIETKFAVVATAYTILGCLLGNFFRVVVGYSVGNGSSPLDVLRNNNFPDLVEQSLSYLSLVDVVYGFVAVFAAVFLARRSLSRSERLAIGRFEMSR